MASHLVWAFTTPHPPLGQILFLSSPYDVLFTIFFPPIWSQFSLKLSTFIFLPADVQVGDLFLHELKQCLNVSEWPAVQNGPSLSEIRRKQGIQEKRLCFCSKFLFHGIFYTFLIYHTPNLSLPELFFLICCCGLSTYNWVTCTILIVSEGYKQ